MREFRNGKIVEVDEPEVSAPETLEISLLRKRNDGAWFNINMGWVSDISLATVVSPYVLSTLNTLHDSATWEVVSFVEKPF